MKTIWLDISDPAATAFDRLKIRRMTDYTARRLPADPERVYSACVCNGLGVTKSTLAGMLIADHATGTGGPMVEAMLAAPRPSRLPPEPFASIGARARLWWGQRIAGRDL